MEIATRNVDGVAVPEFWSDNAAKVFAARYCRPIRKKETETSALQVFNRLANFWKLDKRLVTDMIEQRALPNSPQFFNAGMLQAYGVKGGEIGLWTIAGKESPDTYSHPQLHACFIQPVEDSLDGILNLLRKEAMLFSRGSGTGTNFSSLRGKGQPISSGGTTSGLMSFLKVFDSLAGSVKSGGTTRRAAKMVVVDADHPEISEFVRWKRDEERKAKALIKAGFEPGWQGEAYNTVSGQNSNNSIRVSNKWMHTCKDNPLWKEIVECAWECADPGLQFSDTINSWNTTEGEIRASNPCAEHLRLDNSACNLASINLVKFWDGKNFDVKSFISCVDRWVQVLDRSVDLAGYPSKEIAETTATYRDLGLGYCNLGYLLAQMGLHYDSTYALTVAPLISSIMTAQAYLSSALLAKDYGAYPGYCPEKHLSVVYRHMDALFDTPDFGGLREYAEDLWVKGYKCARKHGLRNAQLTVIAPTGTIGLVMDCVTTGIEPLFSLDTVKELAGGGKLVQKIEDKSIKTAVGENALSPAEHLSMVAAVQPHISGGISKTVNMPADATLDDVDSIFSKAWASGIKCISVYRDGSKDQPLKANDCPTCGDDEKASCKI